MVIIEPSDDRTRAMWRALIELSREQPQGWTLIGAQMVVLHGFENGRRHMRTSLDADVLADVRIIRRGTQSISRALMKIGFALDGMSPDGIGHRFRSHLAQIDVLGPDGLSARTRLITIPPARTVSVPGGTQALARSELVEINLEGEVAMIPRPNLLGAILLKCRAVGIDDAPKQQRQDLAFLLSLVTNPRALAADIKPTERSWLRARDELLDSTGPVWRAVENAAAALAAYRILANL